MILICEASILTFHPRYIAWSPTHMQAFYFRVSIFIVILFLTAESGKIPRKRNLLIAPFVSPSFPSCHLWREASAVTIARWSNGFSGRIQATEPGIYEKLVSTLANSCICCAREKIFALFRHGWGRWGRLCPQFAARNHLSHSPPPTWKTSLHQIPPPSKVREYEPDIEIEHLSNIQVEHLQRKP